MRPMKKTAVGLAMAGLVAGCAPAEEDLWTAVGVWLLQLTVPTGGSCSDGVSHNFLDGYTPDGATSDWSVTDDAALSDALQFGQISLFDDGTSGVLVVGTAVYPGARQDDGTWIFGWTGSEVSDHVENFDSGTYASTVHVDESSTVSWALTFDPLTATVSGTRDESAQSVTTWTETDEWDPAEVGLQMGTIPSSLYLVYDEGGNDVPLANRPQSAECANSDCDLTVTTTCSPSSQTVTGSWAGYAEEAAYEGVDGAQQPLGNAI